jgi:hypothetical protein
VLTHLVTGNSGVQGCATVLSPGEAATRATNRATKLRRLQRTALSGYGLNKPDAPVHISFRRYRTHEVAGFESGQPGPPDASISAGPLGMNNPAAAERYEPTTTPGTLNPITVPKRRVLIQANRAYLRCARSRGCSRSSGRFLRSLVGRRSRSAASIGNRAAFRGSSYTERVLRREPAASRREIRPLAVSRAPP